MSEACSPWETLMNWAGEVISMTWLAILWFCVNHAAAFVIAGLLDRYPSRRALGLFLTVGLLGSAFILFPSYRFPCRLRSGFAGPSWDSCCISLRGKRGNGCGFTSDSVFPRPSLG